MRRAELRQMAPWQGEESGRKRYIKEIIIKESIKKELGVSEKFEISYAGGCSHEKQTKWLCSSCYFSGSGTFINVSGLFACCPFKIIVRGDKVLNHHTWGRYSKLLKKNLLPISYFKTFIRLCAKPHSSKCVFCLFVCFHTAKVCLSITKQGLISNCCTWKKCSHLCGINNHTVRHLSYYLRP